MVVVNVVVVGILVVTVLVVVAVVKPPSTGIVLVEVVVLDGMVTVLLVLIVNAVDVVELVMVIVCVDAACDVRKQLQTLRATSSTIDRSGGGQLGAMSPTTLGAARFCAGIVTVV